MIKWQCCSSLSFTFTVINNVQLNHYLNILLDWSLEDELWQLILILLLQPVLLNIIRPVHHLALCPDASDYTGRKNKLWMEACVSEHRFKRTVDENVNKGFRSAHTLRSWVTANQTSARAWCPLKSQNIVSHMPGAELTLKNRNSPKITGQTDFFFFFLHLLTMQWTVLAGALLAGTARGAVAMLPLSD